jgi:hypothetical protein
LTVTSDLRRGGEIRDRKNDLSGPGGSQLDHKEEESAR